MVAFATYQDLEKRLKRTFTEDEQEWITTLLDDASAHLRSVIGQEVFPTTTSTFRAYPSGRRVDLPQWPIVSVGGVERDSVAVDYTERHGYVLVDCDAPADVTFTWGYATAPAELTRLACVLVSQTLVTLESQLGLTAGGLSSAALDDFKLAWADAGEMSGMALTPHSEAAIRQQFGRGGVEVVDTRW